MALTTTSVVAVVFVLFATFSVETECTVETVTDGERGGAPYGMGHTIGSDVCAHMLLSAL
jgi:hypothetical protein